MTTDGQMAGAGFVFTPEKDAPDQATCPFCNYAADGWEANDDPLWAFASRASFADGKSHP